MYKWLNPDSHLLRNMCMCTCVYSYIHIYIYMYICGISSHTLVEPTCSSHVLVETHIKFPHSCGNPQLSSHILVGTHIQFPQLVPTILWSVTMALGTTRQMTRWLWIHAQGKYLSHYGAAHTDLFWLIWGQTSWEVVCFTSIHIHTHTTSSTSGVVEWAGQACMERLWEHLRQRHGPKLDIRSLQTCKINTATSIYYGTQILLNSTKARRFVAIAQEVPHTINTGDTC